MASVYNLDPAGTDALVQLPETGIGFQLVSAQFRGAARRFLVLNAERALDISEMPDTLSDSDATVGSWLFDSLSDPASFITSFPPRSFSLLSTRITRGAQTRRLSGAQSRLMRPSTLVKYDLLKAPRRFHRFSPFYPDRRVDSATGSFVAGTYACPESEVPFVPTGFAAVGRFALPSPQPACQHYVIEAAAGTEVLFGTVAPAYGQAGGGVEALFPHGAKNVLSPSVKPSKIPDE